MSTAAEKLEKVEQFFEALHDCIQDYKVAGLTDEEIVARILFIIDTLQMERMTKH